MPISAREQEYEGILLRKIDAISTELEATKHMLVASHDSTAAAIAELLLAEKQRDLLAEELGKHGYLPPCEGTRGDCSEYCDNYCEDMEESACWKHWSEAKAREVANGI